MSDVICWLCDSETERAKRDGRPGLVMMVVAPMSHEKMLEAMCDKHRAAWVAMTQGGGFDIVRQPHERIVP